MDDLNHLLAQSISVITTPLRLNGAENKVLGKVQKDHIPHPYFFLHLDISFLSGYRDLTRLVLDSDSQLAKIDLTIGMIFAKTFRISGDH
ncbi:hypothetical protein BLNAU_16170 [Blattamonas nauphoetae]|uniref:Uncharacterized protein n=1 Tax=Blattamonas nauphoetae TaxID=2049346 RepID=A0ABQ9X8R4_9EUKA|nr:hypothetical protein BLNAU_16170 [Blattamonas nauphoetae]